MRSLSNIFKMAAHLPKKENRRFNKESFIRKFAIIKAKLLVFI